MKPSALATVLAIAAVSGGISVLSHGSDDQPPRTEPIPVAELERGSVVGHLGQPLGKIVTIQGIVADGRFTRAKADEGETLLRVRTVNGQRLREEWLFHFQCSPWATVGKPRVDTEFNYLGYETGGYSGIPAHAFKYIPAVATSRYGFTTSFLVLRDEKNRE